METNELIAKLAKEQNQKLLKEPCYHAAFLVAVAFLYAIIVQYFLGFRQDLALQLHRINFVAELTLLISLAFSSVIAAVLLLYPDKYQKNFLLKIPFILLVCMIIFIGWQLFAPLDLRMALPVNSHNIECLLCIAASAFIPSLMVFYLLKKGATTNSAQAGFFALLIATIIGCITLRLAENNDAIPHLIIWHYLPSLLFSYLGIFVGKILLKW